MKFPIGFLPYVPVKGNYQKESINFGILNPNVGLLLPLGAGKTYVSIQISRYRIQQDNVNKVLVVVPTTLMYNWEEAIYKFSEYDSMVLHGDRPERLRLIYQFKYNDIPFGIINYEALMPFFPDLTKLPLDSITADESARYISNNEANRTKAIITLGDQVKYRQILTGSLIANKPMGIFSQFRFLDQAKMFAPYNKNFYQWRHYFFNEKNFGRYKKFYLDKNKVDLLKSCIFSKSITFSRQEVLKDNPTPVFHTINLIASGSTMSMYYDLEKKVLAEIETAEGTKELNITNIFTRLMRLQQFTSGFIRVDQSSNPVALDRTPKLDALIEEVETIIDAGESMVIFDRFLFSIDMISSILKKLKIKHVVMTGADSAKEKSAKWKGYQHDKTMPVFIGQIAASGIGIELHKLHEKSEEEDFQHIIFYNKTFVLDHYVQACGRIDRIGTTRRSRYVNLILKNTIDEKIHDTLTERGEIADLIMSKGVSGWLKGGHNQEK